ncbi:hypothetical protein [Actinomycetospora corticicola]|uniref:Uncharacterized protein n=1 Tax=Actinomycetospora corticicola TaxID=663602 RepID=A0A7Y9J6U3_9PSEU|nr:hypothetical protein [Actinomycetospora corticicola]
MRRNPNTDDLTYLRTFADDDVIAVVELVRLGVPETTVYRRCRPGGPWRLLAPGVVLLTTGVPTRSQRLRAALLHGGPEHHFMTPDQVIETERQHRAYRSAGLHVIGIRPNRLRLDPDGLYRDVLDARRVAAALPPAEVTWRPDLPSAG